MKTKLDALWQRWGALLVDGAFAAAVVFLFVYRPRTLLYHAILTALLLATVWISYRDSLLSGMFRAALAGGALMLQGLLTAEPDLEQAAALDARDHYTAGHSERVAAYAVDIGRALGLSALELEPVRRPARLHDIGKIGIRDTVLLNGGELSYTQAKEMQRHPRIGAELLISGDGPASHYASSGTV